MTMITVPEVAQILGCCRQTVYNLIGEGRLPVVKLRGHYRIHREKLEKQLAAEAAGMTAFRLHCARRCAGSNSRQTRRPRRC